MRGKTLRSTNIHVIGVPEGEARKNGAEAVLEDRTATDGGDSQSAKPRSSAGSISTFQYHRRRHLPTIVGGKRKSFRLSPAQIYSPNSLHDLQTEAESLTLATFNTTGLRIY